MRRLLLFIAVLALLAWRKRAFEAHDRANGFGAYAPLQPQRDG